MESTMDLAAFKADYDWRAAFGQADTGEYVYSDQVGLIDEVAEVIASSPGENDGADWIAVVRMTAGDFIVMRAGCDYTGWDCQAGGKIEKYATLSEAVSKLTLTEEERQRLGDEIRAKGIPTDWE